MNFTKTDRWVLLALLAALGMILLPLGAFASNLRAIPSVPAMLPGLPLGPATLPGRALPLPGAVTLPGRAIHLPLALPTRPLPLVGLPSSRLPGPANPVPVVPTIRVQYAQFATAAEPSREGSERKEKLDQAFDKGGRPAPAPVEEATRRDDSRYTLPEADLLKEIGL